MNTKLCSALALAIATVIGGCGAQGGAQGSEVAADQGDELSSPAVARVLRGLNWSRYRSFLQSDHLYNGTLFGIQDDVWILGAYKESSCDVRDKVRHGCVYDYVMVEVGPHGEAAGHHAGESAGKIVYDETPGLVPGFAPDDRVEFTITVTFDDTGSFNVGDVLTFAQARVWDRETRRSLVAEWAAADASVSGPVPGFRWETAGGASFRERYCPTSDVVYPGHRCAAHCTEGVPSHPTVPRCPLFPTQ